MFLFEVAIIGKETETAKARIILPPTAILANDTAAAATIAGQKVSGEDLSDCEVIVRLFK